MPKTVKHPKQEATADDFVRVWGEAVKQTKAAMMLDVSPATIARMISDGRLLAAPNGSVLVRSIHTYVYSRPKRGGLRIAK